MKNSIEEDIKILDEMIFNCKYKHNYYDEYANRKAKVLERCKRILKDNKKQEDRIEEDKDYEKIFKIELNNDNAKEILESIFDKIEIKGAELYIFKQAVKRVLKENEQLSTEVNSLKGKLDEVNKINFPIIN